MLPGRMRLQEILSPEDFLLGFEPTDKWDAIDRLVHWLRDRGRIPVGLAPALSEAVLARERSMSTGMEHGIAIPHAAVDGVETVVAAMGVVNDPQGLTFESIDGRPTRVVVLLVIPRAQKLLHIRTLADVARTLSRDDLREELMAATDAESAHGILSRAER
jgi:mannitol/fructose-specific phosphotransferase system IIA component (Ntr-type)